MMKKVDVLIIGGGPAGVVAAVTAKKRYPEKEIALIRKTEKAIIPCGIPYIFSRLSSVEDNLMPDAPLKNNGINLIIDQVIKIEPSEKKVILEKGKELFYDKLILALGSEAHLIPLSGIEKEGVWLIKKDYDYLIKLREAVLKAKNIVIVGGGFIGVEIADDISRIKNKNINIVELLDHCLAANFDQEFAKVAEEQLKNKGVKIYTKTKIQNIGGKERVEFVELDKGEKIPADLVIISIGAKPNIKLAKEAGINTEERGGIWVDEYLRTNIPDIFAVGDCAQTRDFVTGKNIPILLASVATSEARIAANNLYQLELIRENKGTVGVFSTKVGDLVLAAAGITENRAKKEGFDYIVGQAEAPNHHPGKLPETKSIKVKLIFAKSSENLLLGAEIMGPESISEMINILALAIQQKTSLFDFNTWQIATHPLLTSAPTVYPLIKASQEAMMKLVKNK